MIAQNKQHKKIKIVYEVNLSLPKIQANLLARRCDKYHAYAVEAIGNEGVLSIKGRNDNGVIRIIRYTGVGISKGDRYIFEPFYNKGSGR